MAGFNDVATNKEILRIADAIRAVTRTAEGMTIPEMPDRLMEIRVVECKDVQVQLNTQGEVLLGVFDQELKHMFVVTPYTDQDNEAVNAAGVQRELIFDQGTGSLYLYEEVETELTARFIVMDFLLASDQTSGGVMMKDEIQDISGKLDKVTSTGYGRVYGITSQGLQTTRDCRDAAVAESLPIRNADGTFQIGEPKSNTHPATKKYVDSAVAAITPATIGAATPDYVNDKVAAALGAAEAALSEV